MRKRRVINITTSSIEDARYLKIGYMVLDKRSIFFSGEVEPMLRVPPLDFMFKFQPCGKEK